MKSPLRVVCHLFLAAVTIVLSSSLARADWPPITPEESSMTSVPQQPGAAAVILIREETDDDLLHYHSVYMRIKILTEAGRKYANVELPYDRRRSGIAEVSGRTVHADGSIVPMQGKPMDKVVLKDHGVRVYVKSFNLPDAQVGSILDYRYELHYGDKWLYPPEWIIQSDLFQKKANFRFVFYDREWERNGRVGQGVAWTPFLPNGMEVQIHTMPKNGYGQNANPDYVDLHASDVAAFITEPHMLPPNQIKWRVEFYYRSSYKPEDYWKEEGKDWNKEVDGFLGHKKGVQDAVAQVTAGAATPDDKVFKLYYFVSRLENRSYEPARPVQEAQTLGLKPIRGAEDVLEQKAGDHDELNRLFVAMVHAAGIPAWLMRVPDRSFEFFQPQFLSTDQFDAEIAIVQLNGKEVFLDPGTRFCPYGLLEWRYGGVQGLRQSATKGTEIATTPMSTYKDAMIQRMARFQLTDHGTVEGTLTVGFYGLEAMNRRQEGSRTDAEGRKKLLEEEVRHWLPGGSDVSLTNSPPWENTVAPLVAEFKISSPLATSAGKRWIIPVHVLQVNETPMFSASTRANAVYFDYPSEEIDEVHISLPPGMEVESLPPSDKVRITYAQYITDQKQESPTSILAVRQIAMAVAAFKVDEYKDVKDFYDKVKAGDDQPAVLRGAAHVAGN